MALSHFDSIGRPAALKGIKVWDGVDNLEAAYWLDQTKAPFKKA